MFKPSAWHVVVTLWCGGLSENLKILVPCSVNSIILTASCRGFLIHMSKNRGKQHLALLYLRVSPSCLAWLGCPLSLRRQNCETRSIFCCHFLPHLTTIFCPKNSLNKDTARKNILVLPDVSQNTKDFLKILYRRPQEKTERMSKSNQSDTQCLSDDLDAESHICILVGPCLSLYLGRRAAQPLLMLWFPPTHIWPKTGLSIIHQRNLLNQFQS